MSGINAPVKVNNLIRMKYPKRLLYRQLAGGKRHWDIYRAARGGRNDVRLFVRPANYLDGVRV